MKARGIGTMINARHPRSVPAHCTPRLLNICFENSGNAAPTADRMIVLAANTDAALGNWLEMAFLESNTEILQGEIGINQVVETLQEDHVDPEAGDNSTRSWCHPVDGFCPSCPAEPE